MNIASSVSNKIWSLNNMKLSIYFLQPPNMYLTIDSGRRRIGNWSLGREYVDREKN